MPPDTDNDSVKEQIGQVRKEVSTSVIDCPNNSQPSVTGMTCQNPYIYDTICAGKQSIYNFCSSDPDSADSVRLNLKKEDLPDSVNWFIKNPKAQYQQGILKWTPEQEHVRKDLYDFRVLAIDDNCPFNASYSESFNIKVITGAKASYTYENVKCGQCQFKARPEMGDSLKYLWSGKGGLKDSGKSITHTYQDSGEYPFQLNVENLNTGCKTIYHDTVTVDPFLNMTIGQDTILCSGSSIKISSKIRDNKGRVSHLLHDSVSARSSRIFQNLKKDSIISLKVQDSVCSAKDSIFLDIRQNPQVDIGPDTQRICTLDSLRLTADSGYFAYQWHNGDTAYHTTVRQQQLAAVKVTDTIGCSTRDSSQVISLDTGVNTYQVTSCGKYQWPVNNQTYTKSGIYRDTLFNLEWCDSLDRKSVV